MLWFLWLSSYVMIEPFAKQKREKRKKKLIIIRRITRRFDEISAFIVVN